MIPWRTGQPHSRTCDGSSANVGKIFFGGGEGEKDSQGGYCRLLPWKGLGGDFIVWGVENGAVDKDQSRGKPAFSFKAGVLEFPSWCSG